MDTREIWTCSQRIRSSLARHMLDIFVLPDCCSCDGGNDELELGIVGSDDDLRRWMVFWSSEAQVHGSESDLMRVGGGRSSCYNFVPARSIVWRVCHGLAHCSPVPWVRG